MHSFRLTLEYDGTEYSGWQRQPDRRTVEGVLRAAITAVTGQSEDEIEMSAASRTDAGVHSHGQVVGCRLSRAWSPVRLAAAVNAKLPEDVVVREADEAPEGFHARFDAIDRSYRYLVVSRRHKSPLTRRFAWTVNDELDLDAMRRAAEMLLGDHDFAAFGRALDGGPTVRTVTAASVRTVTGRDEELTYVIEITANAFLRGMMRGIAGGLVAVGSGKMTAAQFAAKLRGGDTGAIHLTMAPANGLHQWKVTYQ